MNETINTNERTPEMTDEKQGKICLVKGCDKLCGFPAHATIIRKNRCVKCSGGLAPDLKGETKWDEHSFKCEKCGNLETK